MQVTWQVMVLLRKTLLKIKNSYKKKLFSLLKINRLHMLCLFRVNSWLLTSTHEASTPTVSATTRSHAVGARRTFKTALMTPTKTAMEERQLELDVVDL